MNRILTFKNIIIIIILLFSFAIISEENEKSDSDFKENNYLIIGLLGGYSESIYKNHSYTEESNIFLNNTAIPFIDMKYNRLSFSTDKISYDIIQTDTFYFTLNAKYISEPYSSDTSSKSLENMTDKKETIELGTAISYSNDFWGDISISQSTDIFEVHNGNTVSINWTMDFYVDEFIIWTPSLSANFLNSNFTEYYYGVGEDEVQTGRPQYYPGNSFKYSADMNLMIFLSNHLLIFGDAGLDFYDNNIENSPITESHLAWNFALGLSYLF